MENSEHYRHPAFPVKIERSCYHPYCVVCGKNIYEMTDHLICSECDTKQV